MLDGKMPMYHSTGVHNEGQDIWDYIIFFLENMGNFGKIQENLRNLGTILENLENLGIF
jgi:hypothetical protein